MGWKKTTNILLVLGFQINKQFNCLEYCFIAWLSTCVASLHYYIHLQLSFACLKNIQWYVLVYKTCVDSQSNHCPLCILSRRNSQLYTLCPISAPVKWKIQGHVDKWIIQAIANAINTRMLLTGKLLIEKYKIMLINGSFKP